MSFIRPPAVRSVVRTPSRPPSPPRTQQQRQPSPQSRSPQRQQQPAQASGRGWQHQASNQQGRPQQTSTSGGGWQDQGNQQGRPQQTSTSGGGWQHQGNKQGSQQARPIRGGSGWPVQVNPQTGERLGLKGGSPRNEYEKLVDVAQREVDDLKTQLESLRTSLNQEGDIEKRKIIGSNIRSVSGKLQGAERKLEKAKNLIPEVITVTVTPDINYYLNQ
jgi:hypothetical protein